MKGEGEGEGRGCRVRVRVEGAGEGWVRVRFGMERLVRTALVVRRLGSRHRSEHGHFPLWHVTRQQRLRTDASSGSR